MTTTPNTLLTSLDDNWNEAIENFTQNTSTQIEQDYIQNIKDSGEFTQDDLYFLCDTNQDGKLGFADDGVLNNLKGLSLFDPNIYDDLSNEFIAIMTSGPLYLQLNTIEQLRRLPIEEATPYLEEAIGLTSYDKAKELATKYLEQYQETYLQNLENEPSSEEIESLINTILTSDNIQNKIDSVKALQNNHSQRAYDFLKTQVLRENDTLYNMAKSLGFNYDDHNKDTEHNRQLKEYRKTLHQAFSQHPLFNARLELQDLHAKEHRDFRWFELEGVDLSDLNLSDCDFTEANLNQTYIENTDLTSSNLAPFFSCYVSDTDTDNINDRIRADVLEKTIEELENATNLPKQRKIDLISIITKYDTPKTIPVLMSQFSDNDYKVRIAAEKALVTVYNNHPKQSLDPLYSALESNNAIFFWAATRVLQNINRPDSYQVLTNAISKNENQTKKLLKKYSGAYAIETIESTIKSIGELANPIALDFLINKLKPYDKSFDYKAHIYISISKIYQAHPELNLDPIHDLMNGDTIISIETARLLGKIKHPESCDTLISFIKREPGNSHTAIAALGEIAQPDTIEFLISCFDNNYRGEPAAQSVIKIYLANPAENLTPLFKALENLNPNIRLGAINVLSVLNRPEAIPELIKMLGDNNNAVKESAIKALAETKAIEALPALEKVYVSDKNVIIKNMALQAILKIKEANNLD